jgi:hypothetical protein
MSNASLRKRLLHSRRLHPIVEGALRAYGRLRARRYDVRNTLVVSGSPRSGTTWVAELVATLPGHFILFEPIFPARNPEVRRHGFYTDTYLSPDDPAPEQQDYMRRLLSGADITVSRLLVRRFQMISLLCFQGMIAKFVHGNLLLPWMLHRFPLRAVLVVRHPCAVVASQLKSESWEPLRISVESGEIRDRIESGNWRWPDALAQRFPPLHEAFCSIETFEEYLTFDWLIQNYVPLALPRSPALFVTTYEKLVEEEAAEMTRIFNHFGHAIPPRAHAQFRRPSATTVQSSNVATGRNPLTTWTHTLSLNQTEQILEFTHRFGVDFYSDDLTPDYDRLAAWPPASVQNQNLS